MFLPETIVNSIYALAYVSTSGKGVTLLMLDYAVFLSLQLMSRTDMRKMGFLALCCSTMIMGMTACGDHEDQGSAASDKKSTSTRDTISTKTELLSKHLPQEAYGVQYDTLKKLKKTVKRNQNLSEILQQYSISFQTIDKVARKSKNVFDVRTIKTGNAYCILYSEDSTKCARYFIYEKSPVEFVVYDLQDSLRVYEGKKDVTVKEKTASGVIDNSLYMTMQENDLSPLLAAELSEIYAWAIDFYRIQEGDRFKVIYEERFVDGESIGIGEIHTADFRHKGEDYYAFRFQQEGKSDYFNKEAESLRKAFLKAPVRYSRITSGYTGRRYHPVQKRYKAHRGVDYAAPTGTPIRATGDGTVIAARYSKYNGRFVKIRHNSTYSTQYLHMNRIKSGIRTGVRVNQGDVIGFVGSTGLATGPHICYRFWKHGRQVNPMTQDIPASEPVKEETMKAFKEVKKKFMAQLEEIDFDQQKDKKKEPPFISKAPVRVDQRDFSFSGLADRIAVKWHIFHH
jgi:murein DD-endopeptidase MepM/ murein hydrolase activator NlpD